MTTTKRNAKKLNIAIAPAIRNFKPPEDLTVSEWADKYRRLSPENSAEAGPWRTSRTPYLREVMDCFTDPKVRKIVMVAASQVGKALAIDTPIPTPAGWATMEELQPGDKVFDENGKPCNVIAATEIMHNRKCYEVTFSDNSKIIADACHKWYVESYIALKMEHGKGIYNGVLTTEEMAKNFLHEVNGNKRNNYAVPVCKPLELTEKELPLPPYTLGVWLGDGNSCSAQFTTPKFDAEILDHIKADGVEIEVMEKTKEIYTVKIMPQIKQKDKRYCERGHDMDILGRTKKGYCAECARQHSMHFQYGKPIDPIINKQVTGHSILLKMGLIGNKHIPPEYLRASYAQRLALLQGIMDTDGSISKKGACEITLKSKQLIDDVSELLHSLGIKHTVKHKVAICTNATKNKYSDVYRIAFMAYDDTPVFRLKRKLERMACRDGVGPGGKPRRTTETDRRRIIDIKEIESVPVKCISVDSASHLYLAGRQMIPTHNSECILNSIGYIIDQDPGSILFVQPTLDDAKKFSRLRIAPMIRDSKKLKSKVADVKSKDSGNTILQKSFPGGMLTITGSNSASALASTPARYIFGDERDRWATSAGTEGDPWELAEARQTTFYNAKSIEVSTPTIKGFSNIENSFYKGTQERWCHMCPECGEYSNIVFDRIRFEHTVEKVRGKKVYSINGPISYICPHCGCMSTEEKMRKQPAKWIAENPAAYDEGVRSFWLNAFSSPWTPWEKICKKFLQAKDDPEALKVVYNTLFGELWEDRGDLADEDEMLARREDYGTNADGSPVEVPESVLVLTCGVDTQDNRLEYEVVGHGHYGETWGIKKGYIMGKPDAAETWQQLDDVIDHVYKFKDSPRGLKISITCVDSGGHYTQEVYEACRARKNKRVFAIKGKGGDGIPFVTPPSKVPIRDNKNVTCWLYTLGVDAGKASIMASLKVQEPGPKYSHFPRGESYGYDLYYFNGLLSEKMERVRSNRGEKWAWVKLPGHNRNEALDCRNYAMAGFRVIDPDTFAVERRIKELPEKKAQQKAPAPRQRRTTKPAHTFDSW